MLDNKENPFDITVSPHNGGGQLRNAFVPLLHSLLLCRIVYGGSCKQKKAFPTFAQNRYRTHYPAFLPNIT